MEAEQMSDDVKALLIEMRQYVVYHGLLIGECVAWARLKEMHGIGEDWDKEDAWLKQYREERSPYPQ